MDFDLNQSFTIIKYRNPVYKYKICWVFVFLIFFSNICFSLTEKKIKQDTDKFDHIMAVIYDRKKNMYATISSINGSEKYQIKSTPVKLDSFTSGLITLRFLTLPEFNKVMAVVKTHTKYFNHIPSSLEYFLKLLKIKPFNLNLNITLIPNQYKIFKKSDYRFAGKKIKLDFINSVGQLEKDNDFTNNYEKYMLDTYPHEIFHFIVGYANLPKMNELREETYASIFGRCVEYSISKEVFSDVDILEFPEYFFKNYKKDFNKVRKKISKQHLLKSRYGSILSLYYFQAVANDYTGQNIKSDNIPKFCDKIFSEANFKYPIEKKPPVWFKDFMTKINK